MGDDMTQKSLQSIDRYSIYSFVTMALQLAESWARRWVDVVIRQDRDAYPETIKPRGRAGLVRPLSWPLVSTDAPAPPTNDLNIILNNGTRLAVPLIQRDDFCFSIMHYPDA